MNTNEPMDAIQPPPAEWDEHHEMNDAFAQTDEFDEEQDETMFPELAPGLLRIPVILGLEALISGRILTEDAPIWWSIMLWTIFLIPIVLSDHHLPTYYKLVFIYSMHSLLNLVDSFLLNLPRPATAPILGLIGWESMKLEDFQYLVRTAFMMFNLVSFRGILINLCKNPADRWPLTSLLPIWITATMIFSNFKFLGSLVLFSFRLTLMLHLMYPLMYDFVFFHGPVLYATMSERVSQENSNLLKVSCKMVFDRICNINPEPYVILHVLLKSVIIKAMLHYVSAFLELDEKIQPTIELSPSTNTISFKDINSTGLALLNLTAQSVSSFTSTGYFGDETYFPFHGFSSSDEVAFNSRQSLVLISTDSMLTVCAVAYFFATPGEYVGLAFQRWLTNGAEPQDPNERGALMGRFLAMLHSFMALQTGITWMEPNDRLDRFDKNLWLIGVACLHYLHEMVDAELTQMNDLRCVKRRLSAMGALLLIGISIDVHLVMNYQISTWFIPVFIFTLELIIKTHTSFAVYYMLKNDISEEKIFWTKIFSKACELIGGFIMLMNAIYVLIFHKPIMLMVRVIMMMIHTYFNIYRTARKMYEKIRLRLQTEAYLDDLKVIEVSEIPEPDRLCAICYEDFTENGPAVVETACCHRFHKQCIKKWLQLKNVCPLCHRKVFKDKNSTEEENPAGEPDANDNEELNVDDFFEDLL